MHTATLSAHPQRLRATALAAAVLVIAVATSSSTSDVSSARVDLAGPHRIHGTIADVLVRVYGREACSGTPITGTRYVVTAAHCVLDPAGGTSQASVKRGGITYPADAVLVDNRYLDAPSARLDAAVLVMDQALPGPSATIGTAIPATGSVTLAGLQPLDSDGTLLRGTNPREIPTPRGATGTYLNIVTAPAGCTLPTTSLSLRGDQVDVPCGLIPGASGGGLFARTDTTIVLLGIVSNVTTDQTVNGAVPLVSLQRLLRHPAAYRHAITATDHTQQAKRVIRM
jgi:hypothetical protein